MSIEFNRAEYRRQRKAAEKAEKHINLKQEDIQKMKKEAVETASNTAFTLLLSLPLIVLRDKYGFGKKRLETFQEYLIEQYQCFGAGLITLEELREVIESETGMKLKTENDFEIYKEK